MMTFNHFGSVQAKTRASLISCSRVVSVIRKSLLPLLELTAVKSKSEISVDREAIVTACLNYFKVVAIVVTMRISFHHYRILVL